MLNKFHVFAMFGLVCVNSVLAQTLPASQPATVGQLAQMQDRLAESETRRQAAEQALAQQPAVKTTKMSPRRAGGRESGAAGNVMPPADLPVVKLVHGAKDELHAIFLFANGAQVDARLGDILPGAYTLSEISAEQVVLSQGKQRYPLAFSAIAPTQGMSTAGATDTDMQIKAIPVDLIPGAPFKMPGFKPQQSQQSKERINGQ